METKINNPLDAKIFDLVYAASLDNTKTFMNINEPLEERKQKMIQKSEETAIAIRNLFMRLRKEGMI